MSSPLLAFDEALEIVLREAATLPAPVTENLPLLACRGRIFAEPVLADRDQPPFDRATRDGYAVRAAELTPEARLPITGQIRAGELWTGGSLAPASAIEIMTGAPVPPGANAVVMVEHVEHDQNMIRIAPNRSLHAGENVVPQGSEARTGQTVLPSGLRIGAAEIALAAACGASILAVYRRPRVALIATGDELVEIDQVPAMHQIRNSNSYTLAALVEAAGAEPVRLPITPDDRDALHAIIAEARRCDLIILTGGVSMGKYDLVEEVLSRLGAEFLFTGVRMQPGKPVVFGTLPTSGEQAARYFFGLPGNPISTQVTFHAFAEPLLHALSGAPAEPPHFVLATLAEPVSGKPELTRLLPAHLTGTEVRIVPWQGSGDLAANARANCYALLPAGRTSFETGELLRVLLR